MVISVTAKSARFDVGIIAMKVLYLLVEAEVTLPTTRILRESEKELLEIVCFANGLLSNFVFLHSKRCSVAICN
jgi:hypothetical protein